jgi:hypothetical protein
VVDLKSDLKVVSGGKISLLFCPFDSAESFVLSRPSACRMAQDSVAQDSVMTWTVPGIGHSSAT